MLLPTMSAINSNNVEEHEQGHIQGALYLAAAVLDVIVVGIAFILPKNKADSITRDVKEQKPDNNLTDASNSSAPLLDDANSL
eukprot:10330300-Ditylum_brightwellii.AAC.1